MIYQNPYKNTSPLEVRKLIREGKITGQTSGMCDGYAQANLCILPEKYAYDFLLFCQRNPQSCPLLERLIAYNLHLVSQYYPFDTVR